MTAPLHIPPSGPTSQCMTAPSGTGEFLGHIKDRLRRFTAERDWDRFHSPKNLSMALIGEAAELVEHFQWLTEEESACLSPDKLEQVKMELADVLIYLVCLADRLDIDLAEAVERKITVNESKYPADEVRGDARKYTEYRDKGAG